MVAAARIRFYDRIWFRTINTPKGSAGTYNYLRNLVDEAEDYAKQIAPIGNDGDRRPSDRGRGLADRYVGKFEQTTLGSNQRGPRRQLFNTAKYAGNVEFGRRSTLYRKFESFYSGYRPYHRVRYKGRPPRAVWGTAGWNGKFVLTRAREHAVSKIGTGAYVSGFKRAAR